MKSTQNNGQGVDIASLSEPEMRRALGLLPPVQVRRLVQRLNEENQQ
ncbi:hypothetical protein FF011L_03500 [Roseimaritima multifibrata]|uniref:Uncharacterized protein n=1 Tax=Roseimaritima multifibrata TaxID=1930274 RepID=A0A517M9Q2_9BACT|nr:hypothetical protein [Roseimaritima multifibrata]QDS91620.1 hypothetical protein FF011L_03500 [Roseimaritima multifibrata]